LQQLPEVKDGVAHNIGDTEEAPEYHTGPEDQAEESPSEFFPVVSRIGRKRGAIRSFAQWLCIA
jgi:hypothetical protein